MIIWGALRLCGFELCARPRGSQRSIPGTHFDSLMLVLLSVSLYCDGQSSEAGRAKLFDWTVPKHSVEFFLSFPSVSPSGSRSVIHWMDAGYEALKAV